jgi:serine protease DegQ
MRKFWLLFSQAVTISLAVLLVLTLFKPALFGTTRNPIVAIQEAPLVEGAPNAAPSSYSGAVKRAMPAVVNVYTSKEIRAPIPPLLDDPLLRRFFGDPSQLEAQRASSLGSGVIVSGDGYIITNHHVIAAADQIEVALGDGRTAAAQVVGSDPDTDLAVLKVGLKNLRPITFGHADKAQVGDVVLAIGNPFGVGQTVTQGIVSALGRNHLGINTFENFIQTDASINPGNSGGALVDSNGNLIGINSVIYSQSGGSQGIGFAIPSSLAQQVMEEIIRHGAVVRGWIGVEGDDVTPEIAQAYGMPRTEGVVVAGVVRGGPAHKGGIRPGDIIVALDEKPIADADALLNTVAALRPGHAASVHLLRERRELVARVEIGRRPRLEKPLELP